MDSGTVPISAVSDGRLYKDGLVQKMRYTRNKNRYISNAGGEGDFLLTPHTAFFKPTDSA
jgi:hypothetical protein